MNEYKKAKINISRPTFGTGKDVIEIVVKDESSKLNFLNLEISLEDFSKALTGLANVSAQMRVNNLDKVGKLKITEPFEIELGDHDFSNRKELAVKKAIELCPEGWNVSTSFSSQNSFFTKENKVMARTQIFKWIDSEENPEHFQQGEYVKLIKDLPLSFQDPMSKTLGIETILPKGMPGSIVKLDEDSNRYIVSFGNLVCSVDIEYLTRD